MHVQYRGAFPDATGVAPALSSFIDTISASRYSYQSFKVTKATRLKGTVLALSSAIFYDVASMRNTSDAVSNADESGRTN